MKTITQQEIDLIINKLPDNAKQSDIHKAIKIYLFESEYRKTLQEKSEQITKFLKCGVHKWIKSPNDTEQLTITCNIETINKEDLILINDCIARFFDYSISRCDNNKVSIIFLENLVHKSNLRDIFVVKL
jgi:hypothetical protein